MFRLSALLCACLFIALLIAGNDNGQMRPGLAKAVDEGTPIVVIERQFSAPVQMAAAPLVTPSDVLPPPIEITPSVAPPKAAAAPEESEKRVFTLSYLTEGGSDQPSFDPAEDNAAPMTAAPAPDAAPNDDVAQSNGQSGWIELPAQPDATNPDAVANSENFIASQDPYLSGQDPYLSTQEPYGLDARFAPAPQMTGETVPLDQDAALEATVWYVNAQQVNVRQAPSTSAAVVDRLVNGEAVTVLGDTSGDWVRVTIQGDGVEGWIATRLLSRY